MSNSLKHLTEWLSKNNFSEPKKDARNHFIAYSTEKGSISIRTINRASYQPHVNCVRRDIFEAHKALAKNRGCSALYYVIFLEGNGIQLIIPDTIVERNLKKDWLVLSLEKNHKNAPPLPGITVRVI
ncbi:hypothetical protein [Paenibacillus sinopodophylli]|uniref:hypothetical protein n=1 Tax=Paenibacillus sinopodophylli TaxID=1837342 RepID=UPI00110D0942|nr:hypothetical protein [Paenibacillus sinopodophylli]